MTGTDQQRAARREGRTRDREEKRGLFFIPGEGAGKRWQPLSLPRVERGEKPDELDFFSLPTVKLASVLSG